jgi:OOP family OmpA-OmpF porin
MFSMNKVTFALSTIVSATISSLLLTAPVVADDGFYAELSAGTAKNKTKSVFNSTYRSTFQGQNETETDVDSQSASQNSTAFGIRLGYQFNDYFAFELGHHQYGEAKKSYVDEYSDTITDKLESSSTSAGIKGMLPLTDDFSLFARGGLAKWDVKGTSSDSYDPGEVYQLKKDGNDIYYGVGVEYSFTERVSLGLEYSVLDMDWSNNTSQDYGDFSYSVAGNFNYKVENLSLLLKVSF